VRALTRLDRRVQNKCLYEPLATADPVVQNIIDKETWRQFTGLELIASEVRAPPPPLPAAADVTHLLEPDVARDDAGERLDPDEQVLRGPPERALLRRQRVRRPLTRVLAELTRAAGGSTSSRSCAASARSRPSTSTRPSGA
jgi:hypothetical protein